nr:hypothetical protein [Tanacetum cinerariifolium]
TMADMSNPASDVPAEQAPAKYQRNPIFPIVVAILKNTNFFRAFTASSTILAIYIQQLWDTMCFNSSTRLYSCQLDEERFNLYKDILKDALDITPTNDNNPYVAPPSSDIVIEYVNTLGYLSTLRNVSAKTSCAADSLRKNLTTTSRGKKKTTHLLIPSVRFVRNEGREIFGMPIPNALLTDEIKGAPYYGEYQEHVANVEDVLVEEPAYNEEEANLQRDLKLSLKEQAERTQGPARLVVIREPDSRRIQPLPNVQGKGKEKVINEQAAHDLLTLLTSKNKSPVN